MSYLTYVIFNKHKRAIYLFLLELGGNVYLWENFSAEASS